VAKIVPEEDMPFWKTERRSISCSIPRCAFAHNVGQVLETLWAGLRGLLD